MYPLIFICVLYQYAIYIDINIYHSYSIINSQYSLYSLVFSFISSFLKQSLEKYK